MFVPACGHVGRQVHADAAIPPGAGDFFHGPFGIEQRDVGNRLQPCLVFAGEVGNPAVVGARIGGRQFRVLHRAFPTDAQRGVEHGDVDVLVVHHLEARPRVVAALRTAVRVRQLAILLQRDRVHPDSAQHAHVSAHEFQRAVVDQQHLVVVFITVDANGPVAVRGVDIAEPQVRGFHHVAVGIDHRTLRQLRGAGAHAVLPLLHFHADFPASLLRPDARFGVALFASTKGVPPAPGGSASRKRTSFSRESAPNGLVSVSKENHRQEDSGTVSKGSTG